MSTKVYLVRHQHHGVITTHAFTKSPTAEQMKPLLDEAERLHSKKGWGRIVEAELLGPDEMPSVAAAQGTPSTQTENKSDKPKFVASGTGTITAPSGKR